MKKVILCISSLITVMAIAQYPVLEWAKNFGSNALNMSYSMAVDASKNVYTTGVFSVDPEFAPLTDFDPGVGVYSPNNNFNLHDMNLFVSKVDGEGNFLWAKFISCQCFISESSGNSIVVEKSDEGNIYITGYFFGTVDFDPGPNVAFLNSNAEKDLFILKLDNDGNFLWVKAIGGTSNDIGKTIAIDGLGGVYVTGSFNGTVDFNPNLGTFNLTSVGTNGAFVLKLDTDGNLLWAKSVGGDQVNYSYFASITLDTLGNAYITGRFSGTVDFDPNAQSFNLISEGYADIFVLKIDVNGNFVWAKSFGGSSQYPDYATSIVLDRFGNVYTTGGFNGIVDFDPNGGIFNSEDSNGVFILKLDVDGNFVWVKTLIQQGFGVGAGPAIAIDKSGNTYTTGTFVGTVDFDPNLDVFNLTSFVNGAQDIFTLKLDSLGNFIWARGMGGASTDRVYAIAVDESNNIYTTGEFQSTVDFDPNLGVFNLTADVVSFSSSDIFIHKMSQNRSLGMEESKGNKEDFFMIYPNPTNDILNIELKNFQQKMTKVELVNSLGQILTSKTVSNKNNLQLDMKNFDAGVYTLRLLNETNLIETQKILKQ